MRIQTFDYPVIVNDTSNGITLSTSYCYHNWYRTRHGMHLTCQHEQCSFQNLSTECLWKRYNASSYQHWWGSHHYSLIIPLIQHNLKALVLMFGYPFLPLKKLWQRNLFGKIVFFIYLNSAHWFGEFKK